MSILAIIKKLMVIQSFNKIDAEIDALKFKASNVLFFETSLNSEKKAKESINWSIKNTALFS